MLIQIINKAKEKAAKEILAGDFTHDGAFLKVGEVEGYGTPQAKALISKEEIINRAQDFLVRGRKIREAQQEAKS